MVFGVNIHKTSTSNNPSVLLEPYNSFRWTDNYGTYTSDWTSNDIKYHWLSFVSWPNVIDVQPDAPYLTWKKGKVNNDSNFGLFVTQSCCITSVHLECSAQAGVFSWCFLMFLVLDRCDHHVTVHCMEKISVRIHLLPCTDSVAVWLQRLTISRK